MARASATVLVAALVLAACDGSTVFTGGGTKGSGTFKTETRPVEKFTAIRLAVPAELVIERTARKR